MFRLLKEKFKKIAKELTKKTEEKSLIKKLKYRKLTREDIEPTLEKVKISLMEADVALDVAEKIKQDLLRELVGKEIKKKEMQKVINQTIKKSLLDILDLPKMDLLNVSKKPYLVLFLGFNGTGKTTSLAKLAYWLIQHNKTCVLAAADTFRAASIEQLEEHAKNLGVKLIKHKYGADPAAVIFDAVKHAEAKKIDFVLADTAGRSHTNENLMEELKKIIRVNKPDLKVLVIDSLTGNDAIVQAEFFNQVGVDALIFTKVDVNEKGGAILSVAYKLKKPILFLGVGQKYEDIKKFDAVSFVNNLLS